MKIKIDRKRKVLSFGFPEVGRNLFFGNKRRYLYFPEHEFVFPIRSGPISNKPLFFCGHFETYLIFRKNNLIFYPPMTNTNEWGAFCLDHTNYRYDKNMLNLSITCIDQYWTLPFYTCENYHLKNWEITSQQDKYDFKNFLPLIIDTYYNHDRNQRISQAIHTNRFKDISKEEVSALKVEDFIH